MPCYNQVMPCYNHVTSCYNHVTPCHNHVTPCYSDTLPRVTVTRYPVLHWHVILTRSPRSRHASSWSLHGATVRWLCPVSTRSCSSRPSPAPLTSSSSPSCSSCRPNTGPSVSQMACTWNTRALCSSRWERELILALQLVSAIFCVDIQLNDYARVRGIMFVSQSGEDCKASILTNSYLLNIHCNKRNTLTWKWLK